MSACTDMRLWREVTPDGRRVADGSPGEWGAARPSRPAGFALAVKVA